MKSMNNRFFAGLLSVLASVAMMSQVYALKTVNSADDAWNNHKELVAKLFEKSSNGDKAISKEDGIKYLQEPTNIKWFIEELPKKIDAATDADDLIKYSTCAQAVEYAILDWADMALNAEIVGTSTDDLDKATGNSDIEFDGIIDESIKSQSGYQAPQEYKNAQEKVKTMYDELKASVGESLANKVKERCCTQSSAVRSYLKMNCIIENAARASLNDKLIKFAGDMWQKMVDIANYVKIQVTDYVSKTFNASVNDVGQKTVKNKFASKK